MAATSAGKMLDDGFVASTAAQIGEAVDRAAFDLSAWDEVARQLASAFPGSFTIIGNIDSPREISNFLVSDGMSTEYMSSFLDHYVSINPWLPIWNNAPSGTIAASEDMCPTRLFAHTEFYNDWLKPQRVDAAAGMKIDIGPHDTIHLPMHYPMQQAEWYDHAICEVMRRVRGNFSRSVHCARQIAEQIEMGQAAAALAERGDDLAFIVDHRMMLREANEVACSALTEGRLLSSSANRIALCDPEADRWLVSTVGRLARGETCDDYRLLFRRGRKLFKVSVAAAPPERHPLARSIFNGRLVLVLLRDITGSVASPGAALLGSSYALTPAEIRFCELLAENLTIREIAMRQNITDGTARQRIKTIFQKTNTHRQAELVALMLRLA